MEISIHGIDILFYFIVYFSTFLTIFEIEKIQHLRLDGEREHFLIEICLSFFFEAAH